MDCPGRNSRRDVRLRTRLLFGFGIVCACCLAVLTLEGSLSGAFQSSLKIERKQSAKAPSNWTRAKVQLTPQAASALRRPGIQSSPQLQTHEKVRKRSRGRLKWRPRGGQSMHASDFVVAIPGHRGGDMLFFAGRAARQGARTFLATSYEATPEEPYCAVRNETWAFYPDDEPLRSWYPGDTRAALLPFLALQHLMEGPAFKWLFYGDDDTVFFLAAAMEVVKDLDPDLPYFLTDNIWFSTGHDATYHPHPLAPRCLPCASWWAAAVPTSLPMAVGCPCTPEVLCRGAGEERWDVRGCKDRSQPYSLHGGAGALVSIGLLEAVDLETMEACILRQHDSGGDAFLTICLWQQGIGLTTPLPAEHGNAAFDPSPPPLHPDDYILHKAAHVLGNMLLEAGGLCWGRCKAELKHTVSIHLRSRRTGGSAQGTAAFIRLFSRLTSVLDGRSTWGGHAATNDTLDPASELLAQEVDALLRAGIQKAAVLAQQTQVAVEQADGGQLNTRAGSGHVRPLKHAVLSAVMHATAAEVLGQVLDVVKPFATQGLEDETCGAEYTRPKQPYSWLLHRLAARPWFLL